MADRTRPSRAPTSRPRKVAGQRPPAGQPTAAESPETEPLEASEAERPPPPEPPEQQPEWPDEVPHASRRTVVALTAVIVVLVAVVVGEAWYLWGKKDDAVVSAQRPVVVSPLTASSVVDTAAKAAIEFSSASYENYDEHVDDVTKMLTDGFAEQFRQTKAEIREEFIASKTKVSAQVSEQGVVTASPEQVVALLFLTQSTERPKEPLKVDQYKVQVTMVHTSSGWLVSKVDTL